MLTSLAYAVLWVAMLAYIGHIRVNKLWTGRLATAATVISWSLLSVGLGQRGLAAGHWPLTNRYEVALCLVWAIAGIYLLLEASWRERQAGSFVLVMALLVATYAVTRPADERTIGPLLPALRSPWLQIHVLTTLVGYGAFGVAAGLGLMHTHLAPLDATQDAHPETVSRQEIERTMDRIVVLGFPWLTLGILTGAIWAQQAWGRYWGWDPKETWALITWLWYLMILHVRPLPGWSGRRLAVLVVAGFGIVLFTYIGVPWLVRIVRLESLHGF